MQSDLEQKKNRAKLAEGADGLFAAEQPKDGRSKNDARHDLEENRRLIETIGELGRCARRHQSDGEQQKQFAGVQRLGQRGRFDDPASVPHVAHEGTPYLTPKAR